MMRRLLHSVLTSPVAMSIKRPLKDAWWTAKGRSIAPPVLPPQVRSILFVCQGNICRSPFAAADARKQLDQLGRGDVVSESGGLRTNQAAAPPEEARAAARAFEVSLEVHTPVQLSPLLVRSFDLLVVMELRQLEAVRSRFPDAADRTVLLPLFGPAPAGGYARYNIADPFGQPRPAFDRCYARIHEALEALLSQVVGLPTAARQ
jgi:protein-tyrosine phosphatase